MNQLKIFIELSRLNKPIGFMLLFWPCSWGLAYAYYFNQNLNLFVYYLILFFLGSLLMRSAGCIFNDIVDKDFDNKVQRTKKRPIASGKITVKQSLFYVFILCFLAFLILIQFNNLTIMLGMGSMILAFAYPFMKRITYWPQLFLGLTFNWGLIMAWTSITNELNVEIVILYISAIFWTLGYDTIYGTQDLVDDEIIGNKSTSIKFKDKLKLFVGTCYAINIILITYLFYVTGNFKYSIFFIFMYFLTLMYQLKIFSKDNPKKCLDAFKLNNFSGLILFASIILINLG
jgi:4-hydroxybenzoate polyprenyltransferase